MTLAHTKIMLVDDHRLFREALAALLATKPNFEIVGHADDGRAALKVAAEVVPDVIFLDISMPEMGGLTAIKQLKKACPLVRIIMLTMFDRAAYIKEALNQGASGYLLKSESAVNIFNAVEEVMAGKIAISEGLNQLIIRSFTTKDKPDVKKPARECLSNREKEVLQLLVEGYTGKEIASRLNISGKTVEHHRSHLLEKLACRNLAQLVRYSTKEGLI